jgi:hypothetical protein
MGANATTTVPVYVAAEVLTAADLNITNSGIPVFATTVTRDAGFGGAGEKTLAEGQFAYIEASDTTQYYDGSTWQTLGATPGLKVVKAETAFTAAGSFTADGIFTSTYTNYLMIVNLTTVSGTGTLQLRTGGVASTASYNYNTIEGSAGTLANYYTAAGSSLSVRPVSNNVIIPIEIYGPQLAAPTSFYAKNHQGTSAGNQSIISGCHNVSTAYDGIAMSFTTGTGTYTIYGYGKSV